MQLHLHIIFLQINKSVFRMYANIFIKLCKLNHITHIITSDHHCFLVAIN